jgi:uncharacterized ferritin-like protein (DUF455 family)
MTPTQYVEQLLYSPDLGDKLTPPNDLDWEKDTTFSKPLLIMPGREKKIEFSNVQLKFPKASSFHLNEKKAQALHSFANHELLAIEIMAYCFLKFTTKDDVIVRKALLSTIKDEQKHLALYIERIKELGYDFGSFPLNDYFWRQTEKIDSLSSYFATMALTFEAANLDFALFYKKIFSEVEDKRSEEIMNEVYIDEIKHVKLGVHWLRNEIKSSSEQKELWDYYKSLLPENVTPARAKGLFFNEESRKRAGMDDFYIQMQKDYVDDFNVVNRKQWKK